MTELQYTQLSQEFIDIEFKEFLEKLPKKQRNNRINKIRSRFYQKQKDPMSKECLSKAKKLEIMVEYGYFNLTRTI